MAISVRSLFRSLLRLAAISLVLGGLTSPAMAADEKPQPLVSSSWLKARLGDPNIVILDIRSAIDGGGKEAYLKGHIPGAVHTDYDKAGWRVTRNDIPFMVPTTAELEKVIGELGIDEDSYVVVVPAGVNATDFGSAARVYWTLKYVGHRNVSILDGGFSGWRAEQGNVETGENPPSPKIFTAVVEPSLLAEVSEVEAMMGSGRTALVDARSEAFFTGKEKWDRIPAYGHIPGAVNVDSASLYDSERNRLKQKSQLATAFAALPRDGAIAYCNSGHWAATDWFVISEILGRKEAKLYAGSMVEWTADPRRPVESSRTKWDDLKKKLLGRDS
jgi:thiosulfate/3-mercaptopyruvate sulfurtransferase